MCALASLRGASRPVNAPSDGGAEGCRKEDDMAIEITTLVENTGGHHRGLSVEHGLSFLVETETATVLFDTGQSDAFVRNAGKLGKDLRRVDHVVLSHGHYDHGGGFVSFVASREDRRFVVWTGNGFFIPKYALFDSFCQYLGPGFDISFLKRNCIEYNVVASKVEIAKGSWIVTGFSSGRADALHPRFVLRDGDRWVPDRFLDEVSLVVEGGKGLVVLVGCSHPGILNILDTVRTLFGHRHIQAVLGGVHLAEAEASTIGSTLSECSRMGIDILGLCHCSGKEAVDMALAASPANFHNVTGTTIFLE